MVDIVRTKSSSGGAPITNQPNTASVLALVEELEKVQKAGDKSQARKLRSTLRKMGHRGGARAIRKQLAANTAADSKEN